MEQTNSHSEQNASASASTEPTMASAMDVKTSEPDTGNAAGGGTKRKTPDGSVPFEETAAPEPAPPITLNQIEGDEEPSSSDMDVDDDGSVPDWAQASGDEPQEQEEDDDDEDDDDDFVDHRYDHLRRPGEIIRHALRPEPAPAPVTLTRSGRVVKPPVRFVASTRLDGCIDENDYDLDELRMIEEGFGDTSDEEDDDAPEVEAPEELQAALPGFVRADPEFISHLVDDDYKPPVEEDSDDDEEDEDGEGDETEEEDDNSSAATEPDEDEDDDSGSESDSDESD